MESITKDQIKVIHTLKSKLKLSDDHYEALLSKYEVASSKELTKQQASFLIVELLEMNRKQKIKNARSESSKCTKSQLDLIADLWVKLSGGKDFESLRWFIKKTTGTLFLYPETMSHKEATKVINALRSWEAKAKSEDKKALASE